MSTDVLRCFALEALNPIRGERRQRITNNAISAVHTRKKQNASSHSTLLRTEGSHFSRFGPPVRKLHYFGTSTPGRPPRPPLSLSPHIFFSVFPTFRSTLSVFLLSVDDPFFLPHASLFLRYSRRSFYTRMKERYRGNALT